MEWIFLCKEVVMAWLCVMLAFVAWEELLTGQVNKKDMNFNIFMAFMVAIFGGLMTWEATVKVIDICQKFG